MLSLSEQGKLFNMLIQCSKNDINDADMRDNKKFRELLETFQITNETSRINVGKAYVVYAIELTEPYPRFFIADETFSTYPVFHFSPFFKILDPRFSRHWLLEGNRQWEEDFASKNPGLPRLITFKEWARTGSLFYENLIDGEPRESALFEKYMRLMDLEFACPEFQKLAIHLRDSWVQCPLCDDAWEANTYDELLECPTCFQIILSPLPHLNK